MSQSSTSLESFQFTFESILDAKQIEADVSNTVHRLTSWLSDATPV